VRTVVAVTRCRFPLTVNGYIQLGVSWCTWQYFFTTM